MVNRTNEPIKKTNECSLSTIHFLDAPLDKTTIACNLVKEKWCTDPILILIYSWTATKIWCSQNDWKMLNFLLCLLCYLELTFYVCLWKIQQKLLSVTRMEIKTGWKTMFRLFLHDTLCTSQKLQTKCNHHRLDSG